MAYNFIPCDREQSYLMPPSVADWLPEGDLAWFIVMGGFATMPLVWIFL